MRPKKSYGQHFLVSEDIAARIAASLLNEDNYKHILEIGPGRGMLTKYLVQRPEHLVAVEADWEMIDYLKLHFESRGADIIHFDFLRFNPRKCFGEEPFGLIGNFPYNISSQILLRMVKFRDMVPEMVGMFQREVAERIVAGPGSKTYGVISLLVQAHYSGKILFRLEPGAFYPPPKVKSAVIRLRRKPEALGCDYQLFRRVVKAAFSQRRKMMRNSMKTLIKGSPMLQEDIFSKRPEQLSLEQFVELTNRIEKELINESEGKSGQGHQGSDEVEGPGRPAGNEGR